MMPTTLNPELAVLVPSYNLAPPLCKARSINMDPVAADRQPSDDAAEIYSSL